VDAEWPVNGRPWDLVHCCDRVAGIRIRSKVAKNRGARAWEGKRKRGGKEVAC
jgi:hypothetical protein